MRLIAYIEGYYSHKIKMDPGGVHFDFVRIILLFSW